MERMKAKLVGDRPLLLHNGQLANPRSKWARAIKQVTGKRQKTDDDHEEIRKLEWFGGLYLDPDGRVAIPEDVVLGCLVQGGKKLKLGQKVATGVLGAAPYYPLEYDGPRDQGALYDSERFADYRLVGVNKKRIMRSRPRFDKWTLPIELIVDETVVDVREVRSALDAAGQLVGIGDFRPRFGRFHVEAA